MKKLFVLALFFVAITGSFAQANSQPSCTENDLVLAEKFSEDLKKEYDAGKASEIEPLIGDLALIEVRYCAGKLTKRQFCSLYIPKIENLISAVSLTRSLGMSTSIDYYIFLNKLVSARTTCSSN